MPHPYTYQNLATRPSARLNPDNRLDEPFQVVDAATGKAIRTCSTRDLAEAEITRLVELSASETGRFRVRAIMRPRDGREPIYDVQVHAVNADLENVRLVHVTGYGTDESASIVAADAIDKFLQDAKLRA